MKTLCVRLLMMDAFNLVWAVIIAPPLKLVVRKVFKNPQVGEMFRIKAPIVAVSKCC